MSYQAIGLGNQPNDQLGDSGRTGGAKINAMFRELYEMSFTNGNGVRVERTVSDPSNQDLESFRVDDICKRWVDPVAKDRYVEGIVLDESFVFPDDVDDDTKFFKINEKLRG